MDKQYIMEFKKLSISKIIYTVVMILALSACSIFDPYVDRRREAGAEPEKLYKGKSTVTSPAICYNKWTTDFEEIQKLADEECKKHGTGTKAIPTKETVMSCKILVPNHMYFECTE